ncbi:GTP pyrophosphokinase family protein [Bombilactobacillus folatiphilus]|uniref:GTP pyrophosphokinase family protein n=1 Tax=Bombilactobacillus folatiphilus TaxID=2923362 RepID=A0ABY4P807_9LACO|nr:GTP pyrophosphokinase family protein [Bombilactobacillus folatiphilus]UQS81731.1 GTP pyrophosphokinase family protein [Bombilactobacillus folatiphilus]
MSERNWKTFLLPYEQAVDELKIKLRSMRKEFLDAGEHSPIEYVTGRVKSIESIQEKMRRRYISEELLEQDMQDIAGLRIQCQFVEDIYQVVDILHSRTDLSVVEERDYVTTSKPSGYRSYHVVLRYPVQLANGVKDILAEIQIRTLAMNFWSTIEHSLNYKYQGDFPDDINSRLKRAAEASFMLDEEMSKIREEIQDAQKYFSDQKIGDIKYPKENQPHEGVDS